MELGQQGLDGVEVGLRLVVIVGCRLAERNIDVRLCHAGGRWRGASRHPEYGADAVSAVRLWMRGRVRSAQARHGRPSLTPGQQLLQRVRARL